VRRERVRDLLSRVADGAVPVDSALDSLAQEPMESLGFATIDHHRALRQGVPEAVYGPGKSAEQCVRIVDELLTHGSGPVLLTPALIAYGFPASRAIVAGQVVQVLVTPAGAAGHLVHGVPNLPLTIVLGTATAVGVAAGIVGTRRLRPSTRREDEGDARHQRAMYAVPATDHAQFSTHHFGFNPAVS